MKGLTPASFGLIWVTLFFVSFGQLFLKLGQGGAAIPVGQSVAGTFVNILRRMLGRKVIFGFSLYAIGTLFWLMVLTKVPLSVAFPLFSMSYFLVVILSATILKERVDWRFAIVGLLCISIGVTLIGLSSPDKSTSPDAQTSARRHTDHE